MHRLVKPSVDHVCRLKFPSGNYPPCIGDDRDLLVHWCHGSPGVVYMLLQAYKVETELLLQLFFSPQIKVDEISFTDNLMLERIKKSMLTRVMVPSCGEV